MMPRYRAPLLAAVLFAVCVRPAATQKSDDWDTGRVYATRSALEGLLARLDSVARSPVSRDEQRAQARHRLELVGKRLAEGDFQAGDRVLVQVGGEPQLTDTFAVQEGRVLSLSTVGEVHLAGVLRSELEEHLRTQLAAYIKNPVVHARPLMRIAILGEVARPGFYALPPTSRVDDALMAAGGPTHDSNLTRLVIQRTDREVWSGKLLQRAIGEGRSLDELGVRSGDRVVVPRRSDLGRTVSILGVLVTIPVTIYALTRIF